MIVFIFWFTFYYCFVHWYSHFYLINTKSNLNFMFILCFYICLIKQVFLSTIPSFYWIYFFILQMHGLPYSFWFDGLLITFELWFFMIFSILVTQQQLSLILFLLMILVNLHFILNCFSILLMNFLPIFVSHIVWRD